MRIYNKCIVCLIKTNLSPYIIREFSCWVIGCGYWAKRFPAGAIVSSVFFWGQFYICTCHSPSQIPSSRKKVLLGKAQNQHWGHLSRESYTVFPSVPSTLPFCDEKKCGCWIWGNKGTMKHVSRELYGEKVEQAHLAGYGGLVAWWCVCTSAFSVLAPLLWGTPLWTWFLSHHFGSGKVGSAIPRNNYPIAFILSLLSGLNNSARTRGQFGRWRFYHFCSCLTLWHCLKWSAKRSICEQMENKL